MIPNDPRDHDGRRLQQAMHRLGRHPALRAGVLDLLRRAEEQLNYGGAIRDDITGPIADALHDDDDTYEKTLADGTRLRFLFRTKIARDFLMSESEHPSHVWEPQTTRLLLQLARTMGGDALVGGAYFGDQAILLARHLAARDGQVHCFEPNPDQCRMLCENAQLNALHNVRVQRLGLWSSSDARLKLAGFDSFANTVAATPHEHGSFGTASIDDYVAERDITLGLIQLDIEGAEHAALLGAKHTLATQHPHIVFELHRHYVDWSNGLEQTDLCRYLLGFGYSIYALRDFNSHREMGQRAIELVPLDSVVLDGPPHGFNMLAVHDASVIAQPPFRLVEHVSPKLLAHKDPALHHPMEGL
ncbi:MAG: FkbM family methyltransferase [Rubrivivax sp.]